MNNILITGSNGQLGNEIKKLSPKYSEYNFVFTDVGELNITNYDAIDVFFNKNNISFLINCAAYNAVDKAEEDPDTAELINATAVKYLSKLSKKYNAFYIHISTDYVFGGTNHKPYIETDKPKPLSKYALSKFHGEQEALNNNDKSIVFRTSWLYSEFGNNFVKTIMKLGKERDELRIIFDQIGTPTYANDLAKAILNIIPQTSKLTKPELYHYSNEGVASWYDFTKAIIEISKENCNVLPIETKDYPLPTARPFYSVMNKAKIKKDFDIEIPHWRESLARCIKRLEDME